MFTSQFAAIMQGTAREANGTRVVKSGIQLCSRGDKREYAHTRCATREGWSATFIRLAILAVILPEPLGRFTKTPKLAKEERSSCELF